MNGGQHLAIGMVTTGAGLAALHSFAGVQVEVAQVVLAVVVAGVGSLAPDIDHPRSTISFGIPLKLAGGVLKSFMVFGLLGVFLAYGSGKTPTEILWGWYNIHIVKSLTGFLLVIGLVGLGLFIASQLTSVIFGHRGATHSLVFMVGTTALITAGIVFSGGVWWYGLFFGWGWLTHLLADATTRTGLPALFWPFG